MKCVILVSFLLIVQGASAQQIYKSIDRYGNISYSSEPAKGAVKVEKVAPPPSPSPQEVERAQQRYRELEARDAEREMERREQEREIQRQQQIRADLELKRKLAEQKPANVIVINQDPYYWGRPYSRLWYPPVKPRPHPLPVKPRPRPMPEKPIGPKLLHPPVAPYFPRRSSPSRQH